MRKVLPAAAAARQPGCSVLRGQLLIEVRTLFALLLLLSRLWAVLRAKKTKKNVPVHPLAWARTYKTNKAFCTEIREIALSAPAGNNFEGLPRAPEGADRART